MAQTVAIENTDKYIVWSVGNGAAYEFTRKADDASGFVQYGDDATAWRESYDAMQEAYADESSVWHKRTWNACLAELINEYLEAWPY